MGLMGMMGIGIGWTADNGHPRELLLFMGRLCNVFSGGTLLQQRKHIEGRRNALAGLCLLLEEHDIIYRQVGDAVGGVGFAGIGEDVGFADVVFFNLQEMVEGAVDVT